MEQMGGEDVASKERKTGSWTQHQYAVHANELEVGVIEATVCDQLRKYIGGRRERSDYYDKGDQMSQVGLNMSTIKYNV